MEVQTDRVPSLELRREEIRPGVFRVLSDGIRDLEAGSGVRGVAVDPVGRVWVLRGSRGDWTVEQLGVPGVALDPSGARVTLGNFGGTPLITDDGRSMSLEDGSWVEVEGSSSSGCIGFTVPVRDGACWGLGLGRAATERLRSLPVSELAMRRVRSGQWERLIPAELGMERLEGDQGESLSPTDLGLPDGRILDYFTITPDGTVWVAVRSVSPGDVYPTALAGLLRYDGETWTLVPARLSDAPEDALAWTVDLSVTPDGTVWVVEGSPEGMRVRGWDGSTWSAHLASDVPEDWASGGVRAGGTHANADGTIWFLGGRLYFDGESLHPLDPARLPGSVRSSLATYGNPSITPDGTIWLATSDATSDGRLYAITPEAVVVSE
jgi:hypothetical protein